MLEHCWTFDSCVKWGHAMSTTAVFAICLTAPLGAIFINTLGTKWLEYNGDDVDHDNDDRAMDCVVRMILPIAGFLIPF